MVANDPVCICCGVTFLLSRGNFSVEVIVESLEKTLAQIHVSDRVNTFWEFNRAGHLSIAMTPLMLNSFHMPLIDEHNDFLAFCFVNLLEQLFISLIYEKFLVLIEKNVHALDVPVYLMRVHTLFRVGSWTIESDFLSFRSKFMTPLRATILIPPE